MGTQGNRKDQLASAFSWLARRDQLCALGVIPTQRTRPALSSQFGSCNDSRAVTDHSVVRRLGGLGMLLLRFGAPRGLPEFHARWATPPTPAWQQAEFRASVASDICARSHSSSRLLYSPPIPAITIAACLGY